MFGVLAESLLVNHAFPGWVALCQFRSPDSFHKKEVSSVKPPGKLERGMTDENRSSPDVYDGNNPILLGVVVFRSRSYGKIPLKSDVYSWTVPKKCEKTHYQANCSKHNPHD